MSKSNICRLCGLLAFFMVAEATPAHAQWSACSRGKGGFHSKRIGNDWGGANAVYSAGGRYQEFPDNSFCGKKRSWAYTRINVTANLLKMSAKAFDFVANAEATTNTSSTDLRIKVAGKTMSVTPRNGGQRWPRSGSSSYQITFIRRTYVLWAGPVPLPLSASLGARLEGSAEVSATPGNYSVRADASLGTSLNGTGRLSVAWVTGFEFILRVLDTHLAQRLSVQNFQPSGRVTLRLNAARILGRIFVRYPGICRGRWGIPYPCLKKWKKTLFDESYGRYSRELIRF